VEYISNVMLEVLRFFYAVGGHNWGLAIIWLTATVNLALYPLTLSSIQQMAAMQRIQPKMQSLQKKHKDDPKKLQQEMMDLYKGEGVNPIGGCLPVLLKIPFFLALFWVLQSKEFTLLVGEGAVFIPGWIVDIAKQDPFYVLPALIGVSTWLSQKSMPSAPGQSQAILWFMPIFIAFVSYNFAAGVQIYWIISNLMGWAQQTYIMKLRIPKNA
jgi:YidC/Oxa1 family membrane protein insertase